MPVTLQIEKVEEIQSEIDVLAREEHAEMEVGFRPYGPDYTGLIYHEQTGTFKCLTARRHSGGPSGGELVGYFTWMIDFDLESYGTLIVHQCAWYVRPGNFGVAARMFYWATEEFKRLGVKILYLHNAQFGRGQTLGKFFEKNGAVHVSNTYALRL